MDGEFDTLAMTRLAPMHAHRHMYDEQKTDEIDDASRTSRKRTTAPARPKRETLKTIAKQSAVFAATLACVFWIS